LPPHPPPPLLPSPFAMFIGAYASIATPLGLPGGLPVEVCPWWWSTSWPARRRVADGADRGGLAGGAVPPRPRAGTPAAPLVGLRRRPGLGRRGAGTGRHLAADQHRDDPGADHLGAG